MEDLLRRVAARGDGWDGCVELGEIRAEGIEGCCEVREEFGRWAGLQSMEGRLLRRKGVRRLRRKRRRRCGT